MHYNNTGAWAVRQKFLAKKQVFQLVAHNLSTGEPEAIVDQALGKLSAGESEDAVKAWAKAQVSL